MELIFYFIAYIIVEIYTTEISFTAPSYHFANAKKSTIQGFLIIATVILLTVLYMFLFGDFISKLSETGSILMRSFFYFIIILVVIFSVIYNKESLQSVGIMKQDFVKSGLLGTLLGIFFYLFCYILIPDKLTFHIISSRSLISFIGFIILGLGEEMSFRGYLQPRLIAWKGIKKGLLITAILFSFWHLPVNVVNNGMDMMQAIYSCVGLIPLSLLLGVIMLKTKNIVAVVLFHAFIDWVLHT